MPMNISAIKEFIANETVMFNRHDGPAMAMEYVEDADYTTRRGVSSHGRNEIETFLEKVFGKGGALQNAQRIVTVRKIRFLTSMIAEVDLDSTLTGVSRPAGKGSTPRAGLVTDIMSKQNGHWMIITSHETDYPDDSAAASGK